MMVVWGQWYNAYPLVPIGLLYASLQLPLDNRENKNSRNVCLSQTRENIFPRKFLLIQ